MLTRTSAPTSNPSPSPVVIKTIPFFPCQGEFADLKANGQILDQSTLLNIADKITALNAQTSREGDKYSKKDLPALIGINSPFSIFCKGEQYFTSYVKLGDSGSVGTVRLAQNHVTKKWHVFKSVHFKTEDKIEEKNRKEVKAKNDFNVLQQTQTVPGNIGINVSKKGSIKWNYFFDYVPGIDLFKLTEILANNEQILPDVLMLHIAHQLVIALKTLHAHPRFPIFHCDLKRENVVCDLSSKSLAFVDFDSSLPYKPEGHVLTAPRGNYLHGDSRFKSFHQQKCHSLLQGKHFEGSFQYDLNSEIHGLGIMLADLFLLFDPPTFDSTKHE